MKFSKNRAFLVLGIAAYVAAFQWMYVTWLSPTFDYLGFIFEEPPAQYLALAWVLSILPGLWLPLVLTRPSQLIGWVLYLTVLIPSMFVPLFAGLRELNEVAVLMVTLFAGFTVVSVAPIWLPLLKLPRRGSSKIAFWSCFWGATAGLLAWVFFVYFGHFRLVTFGEIYQQLRFSGQELATGTGVGYAIMWLSGAFAPLLMSWALTNRRFHWFFAGAAIQVMLYSTAGLKSILLSIMVMPVIFVLMRWGRIPFGLKLVWLTVLGFVALNAANHLIGELSQSHLMLSALVFMRTFGLSGLSTAQYHDFFSEHPLTHYSHVTGISLFVDYPYAQALGREVGFFYSQNPDLNSNAHLWCMDGLAGLGLPGILLISLLCAAVFWLLDIAADGHDITFSATAVNFAALNLSNVSLFTSLLSGGLIFSILMFYFMPREPMAEEACDTASHEDLKGGSDELAQQLSPRGLMNQAIPPVPIPLPVFALRSRRAE